MASVPFNNLITFSRGSNATVIGSNGLIQWAPNNLLLNSEQFDSAGWGRDDVTVTANTAVAPDGTTTADTVIPSTLNSATHRVRQAVSTSVATHSISVYVKAFGYSKFGIREGNVTGAYGTFNLSTGTVIDQGSGGTATILSVGNGWYRCSVSFTAGATARADLSPLDDAYTSGPPTAYSYAGNGTSGVFIWGAQLELGSAATTYNSTTVKNLLGYSEAFDNAAWTKGGVSIVTGAQANPINGAFNGQKLMEDASTGVHRTLISAPTISGTPYVFSAYIKAAGRTLVMLQVATGVIMSVTFNVATGAITNQTSGIGSITPVGDGWYRIAVSATAATTATPNFQILLVSTGTTTSYTGDGNSGVYIYGAQLSDSASLDPYVPTPAAAPSSTAYYGPRFDYDPVTLAPKGLLVEEARTNLLLRSEEFDNASWSKSSATVTANTTVSPDGTADADTLTSSSNTSGVVERDVTFTGDGDKAVSIFLKAGTSTSTYVFVRDTTASATRGRALITWAGGVPSATADSGGTIQGVDNFGNGWYRIRLLAPSVVAANNNAFRIQPDPALGTGSIIAWGAQAENGAFATSYIPTVASTVTRSADVATINGSLFSQWYGQTQGTFVFVGDAVNIATNSPAYDASDGTNNNRVSVGPDFSSVQAVVRSGGATVATLPRSIGLLAGTVFKHSLAYTVDNFAVALNGGDVATDTSGAVPIGVNQIGLGGNNPLGANKINGHIRSINYIPARAADFQLQALTL